MYWTNSRLFIQWKLGKKQDNAILWTQDMSYLKNMTDKTQIMVVIFQLFFMVIVKPN
jgi:hypothetical protein